MPTSSALQKRRRFDGNFQLFLVLLFLGNSRSFRESDTGGASAKEEEEEGVQCSVRNRSSGFKLCSGKFNFSKSFVIKFYLYFSVDSENKFFNFIMRRFVYKKYAFTTLLSHGCSFLFFDLSVKGICTILNKTRYFVLLSILIINEI